VRIPAQAPATVFFELGVSVCLIVFTGVLDGAGILKVGCCGGLEDGRDGASKAPTLGEEARDAEVEPVIEEATVLLKELVGAYGMVYEDGGGLGVVLRGNRGGGRMIRVGVEDRVSGLALCPWDN